MNAPGIAPPPLPSRHSCSSPSRLRLFHHRLCPDLQADVFIALNASTVELLDLETYCTETVGARPLVAWNLELDSLRADLGECPEGVGDWGLVFPVGVGGWGERLEGVGVGACPYKMGVPGIWAGFFAGGPGGVHWPVMEERRRWGKCSNGSYGWVWW